MIEEKQTGFKNVRARTKVLPNETKQETMTRLKVAVDKVLLDDLPWGTEIDLGEV